MSLGRLSRKDPAVAGILRAWRRLTTPTRARKASRGAPTLVACSGGADSCALLLSLALAGGCRIVVGHVVHDLRPAGESLADRDAVRELAERLGLEFMEERVAVAGGYKGSRNAEAAARKARYEALERMARAAGVRCVATAHHAEDQAETVLMSLLRGTGAGGVRGLAVRRRLGRGPVVLIRPMASPECGGAIDRETCRRICAAAGVAWREDASNADVRRFRSGLRHGVVPKLRELRGDVLERVLSAAEQARGVDGLLRREARRLVGLAREERGGLVWTRAAVRAELSVTIGAALRLARRRLCGRGGEDRAGRRQVAAIARAIRDGSTEPRRFVLGGMEVRVTAREVRVCKQPTDRIASA